MSAYPSLAFLGCEPGGNWNLVDGNWEPADEETAKRFRRLGATVEQTEASQGCAEEDHAKG